MPKLELEVPELEDFKEDIRLKSCLNYVIKNFREVEPILREHWLKQERKKVKYETLPKYSTTLNKEQIKRIEKDKER